MTPSPRSRLVVSVAALAITWSLAACADDATTTDRSQTSVEDGSTADEVDMDPESAGDEQGGTGSEEAGTGSTGAPVPSQTVPPEAQIDISTAPGSGDFVGALEDVQGMTCTSDGGVWSAAGTVVNATGDVVDYRIYVSFLDAAGETVGLVQADVDDVASGDERAWSAEIDWPDSDLRCVLRVERLAANP
jgi:hypothetical protein